MATVVEDRNLRVWSFELDPNDGVHQVKGHYDVPNTKDIVAVYGDYAYGMSLVGEFYRLNVRST